MLRGVAAAAGEVVDAAVAIGAVAAIAEAAITVVVAVMGGVSVETPVHIVHAECMRGL